MSKQIDAGSIQREQLRRQLTVALASRPGCVSSTLEGLIQELRLGSEQTLLFVPVVVNGRKYCMRYVLQEREVQAPGESALTFGLQFVVDEE